MNDTHAGPRPAAIRFEQVSFSYAEATVLSEASFHIHTGEFAALVGPNGAGKTTALRLILGLARPSSGRVTIFGDSPEAVRETMGYVPQHASWDPAFPISVREVVRMGRVRASKRNFTQGDRDAVTKALGLADVAGLADRPYSALSGGQRRRVLVARALATEPRLLILDEPTANMDTESEARLFRALGELKGNTTILIVTHDSGFVSALTDVVFCMGDRTRGKSIVKHQAVSAKHVAEDLYGGPALQVLHDTILPDGSCCSGEDKK